MDARTARRLAVGYFVAYTVALTYPGLAPFNRIRPFVLGLPFSVFWVVLWVALSCVPLWWVRRAERAAGREE